MKAPAAVAPLAIVTTSAALGAERVDCRYYRADEANPATTAEDRGPLEGVLLPDNGVFPPNPGDGIADPRGTASDQCALAGRTVGPPRPNRSKRPWMPAESQTFTSGLFTLLKPPWPTSSCERNVVRPTPT